jgi:tetratricopeptide (TPR) repeat protein
MIDSEMKEPRPKKLPEVTLLKHHTFAQVMANLIDTFNRSDKRKPHRCLKNVDELQPMRLADMQTDTAHTGRFLICRTVEHAVRSRSSIATVVQDEFDEVENVYFYNLTSGGGNDDDPKLILPKFTTLLIKEPYLSPSINDMSELIHIRVESPTDVIILTELDFSDLGTAAAAYDKYLVAKWQADSIELKSSVSNLTRIGDDFLHERNFHQAVRFYTKATNLIKRKQLPCSRADLRHILNGRSCALLGLEKYYLAYRDAVLRLEPPAPDEAALFNAGEALYGMRRFSEACEVFERCVITNALNVQAVEELDRTRRRLNEASSGQYEMKGVIEAAKFESELRLDLADFVSSQIEVVDINGNPNNKGNFYKKMLVS